jgi:hypothetical protein
MRIDLHTHTLRSDGTLTPTGLLEHAAEVGLDVVAITDHDNADGWDEAVQAARSTGVRLIRGMEISCRHQGRPVHLLGYLMDPTLPELDEELHALVEGRERRLPRMIERLNAVGVEITEADVRAVASTARAIGRPHVADALVRRGVVTDRGEAFATLLGPGGPGYVERRAADLQTMIDMVTRAGGVSVIAHPWARRQGRTRWTTADFERFARWGLAGVEVDHQDHDAGAREELRAITGDLGLVATGSSDFHGEGKVAHDLGCNTTDPEELERLLGLAAQAAAASGRQVPEVVGR